MLAPVISLLMAVGLLGAQICDLSCSVLDCSTMMAATAPYQAHNHSHHDSPEQADECHSAHHASSHSEPTPEPGHHSTDCAVHGEFVVALPHDAGHAAATHHVLHPPVADLSFVAVSLFDSDSVSYISERLFRPPPVSRNITVLRI